MTNHVSHIGHMMSCANTGLLCGITGGVKVWVLTLNLVLLIPDFFVDDSGTTTSDWCSVFLRIFISIKAVLYMDSICGVFLGQHCPYLGSVVHVQNHICYSSCHADIS